MYSFLNLILYETSSFWLLIVIKKFKVPTTMHDIIDMCVGIVEGMYVAVQVCLHVIYIMYIQNVHVHG
jgi:hypothetical protein